MIRVLIAIALPLVFLSISWNIIRNNSENALTDISKAATLCAGILAFLSLQPSKMEALYPWFAALFLLSAFAWSVSVHGLREAALKAVVALAGVAFLAWIRPDLFRWVLN